MNARQFKLNVNKVISYIKDFKLFIKLVLNDFRMVTTVLSTDGLINDSYAWVCSNVANHYYRILTIMEHKNDKINFNIQISKAFSVRKNQLIKFLVLQY